jgi:hypothetical protein
MSDVPKNFLLKCQKCLHARMSTGLADDLQDLFEYKSCAHCGGVRKFRCPQCGGTMKLRRVQSNT